MQKHAAWASNRHRTSFARSRTAHIPDVRADPEYTQFEPIERGGVRTLLQAFAASSSAA
jgi:hypothetical protein